MGGSSLLNAVQSARCQISVGSVWSPEAIQQQEPGVPRQTQLNKLRYPLRCPLTFAVRNKSFLWGGWPKFTVPQVDSDEESERKSNGKDPPGRWDVGDACLCCHAYLVFFLGTPRLNPQVVSRSRPFSLWVSEHGPSLSP